MQIEISNYNQILACPTPQAWVDKALSNKATLLIDHANCEKKAAATAMNLMFRYIDKPDLLNKMSRLAREELRHFEQVLAMMNERGIVYDALDASRYAVQLRKSSRSHEPGRLIDLLIIGAFIEARSCERFAKLIPFLETEDKPLADFYRRLVRSEGRHFVDYLTLASKYSDEEIEDRVNLFAAVEQDAILTPDAQFRFHSGVPF